MTGGNRGIGKAIAVGLGASGASVIVVARTEELFTRTVEEIRSKGGRSTFVKCDLSINEEILAVVEGTLRLYGRIDILVNNAGISPVVMESELISIDLWNQVLQVNLLAPFMLCREIGKSMIKHGWGRIINIASAGGFVALPRQIHFCASKAGLI